MINYDTSFSCGEDVQFQKVVHYKAGQVTLFKPKENFPPMLLEKFTLGLSIKTGNAHEEKLLPQTIIIIFKKYGGRGIETPTKLVITAK